MNKKVLALVVFVVLSLFVAAHAKEQVTIVLEVGANNEEFETRKLAIEEFMEANPDIKVDFRLQQGGTAERLTRYIGGAAADVGMEWELEFAGFADKGVYLDLNSFIGKDAEYQKVIKTDTMAPLLQAFQWSGKQLVLPEQNTSVVLFYNKTHYSEAGLTEPPTNWDNPEWTWDVFLQNAKKLTKKDGDTVVRYGYGDIWWTQLTMMMFAWSNGGDWFDRYENPTKSTMSDPKTVEAIEFYGDLWNKWGVAPNWPQRVELNTEKAFADNNLSMGVAGHWFVPWFSSTQVAYDVAPLPRGPKGETGMSDLGTTGLGIYNTTRHPEEAWRLIRYLTGPEGQRIYARSGLFVPVVRSALRDFVKAPVNTPRSDIFFTAASFAKPLPSMVAWGDYVGTAFNPILHEILEGRSSAQTQAILLDELVNNSILRR